MQCSRQCKKVLGALSLAIMLSSCAGADTNGDAEFDNNIDDDSAFEFEFDHDADHDDDDEFDEGEEDNESEEGNDTDDSTDSEVDNETDSQPENGGEGTDVASGAQNGQNPADTHEHMSSGAHCDTTPGFAETSLMTHIATQSGTWSDSQTWGGSIPVDGSLVLIPQGVTVSVASRVPSRLETVRIDGTLDFDTSRHTELQLDSLYSSCGGRLQIGSSEQPVQVDVTARVVFIDDGPVADSQLLSRGAILKGQTTIFGTPKTHRAIISPQARQGDSVINLTVAPSGWQVDDQLIITGTMPNDPASDEIRYIAAIDGTSIELDQPLTLDHTAPRTDLNVYVANTTRNVEFLSESQAVANRGHMMFMSAMANIQNARFTELGRTDKTTELNDFQFEFPDGGHGDDAPASANVIALGGTNIRGRYAVHFHRTGTSQASAPALVKGAVVFNGPGWGFVNHSSHVDFIDNVSYGLQGAGFYTEAGDEIGSMQGNIAIRSVNSSFTVDEQGAIDPDLSAFLMDYGNDGEGFWLTGTRVSLINNVSAGASAHGIIYWTDGIMEPGAATATRVTVKVADLPNGNLIAGRESVPVWWAPLAEVRGNESYGATVGFRARYIHARNYLGRDDESDFHRSPPASYIDTLNPTISDLTVWGNRDGVLLNYNERVNLLGAKIIGFGRDVSQFSFNSGTAKSGIGLDVGNDATHGPAQINDVHIEGFGMGMATPVNGAWSMQGVTLQQNGTDLLVQPVESESTT
ncbi:MAG: G8 domain-containing protein, partial [Pseudomonadota bacterium]